MGVLFVSFCSIHFVHLKTFVNYCNEIENLSPELVLPHKSEALQRSAISLIALWISVSSVATSLPHSLIIRSLSRPELARTIHCLAYFGSPCLWSRPLLFCLGFLELVSARHIASRLGSPLPYLSNWKVSRTRLSHQAVRKPQLPSTY